MDYLKLAGTLRAARERRSARIDAGRADRLSEGAIPLDDVLRYLDTSAASALVGQLTARTNVLLEERRAREQADRAPEPFDIYGDRYLPEDPFERSLVRGIIHQEPYTRQVSEAEVPRALITALAGTTGDDGMLSPRRVEEALGPLGKRVLEAVTSGLAAFHPATERPKLKYDGLEYAVKNKVALSQGRRSFVDRMPAFRELIEHLGGGRALAGFTMTSVQHLFPSTLALYDALGQAGLSRAATGVGGKNYSANPDVTARMQAEGWDVAFEAHPTPQASGLDAEHTVYAMAEGQLRRLFHGCDPSEETKPRFLLLDDGGKLIRCLHEKFPRFAHLCVAVEQTDRGIQIIEEMQRSGIELGCPVVNMARSPVKKRLEAPMIGEAVVASAQRELSRVHPDLRIEPKIATVVGFGAIGEATARALLRRGYTVCVTDPSPDAQRRARELGCTPLPRDEALARGRILYSCTGHTTITPAEYGKLPSGAVLVNAASGNHELGLHEVSADFFGRHDRLAHAGLDGRLHTRFSRLEVDSGDPLADEAMLNRVVRNEQGDHEVLVLRSGYVVNMTDGLPPEYVQLVLGLLYASCVQAATARTPGLIDLDAGPQDFLAARTERALRKIGRSLDAPSFDGLADWQL